MPRLPTLFLSHGSPMHALGSGAKHDTIHDFGGFPPELYRVKYDAPGSPDVAQRTAGLLRDAGMAPTLDGSRGLDHGAWVPLKWMYPQCDVPVVQVSVQTTLGTTHQLGLGVALAPLADEGVLVIGSGHATHNLSDWFAHHADPRPLEYVVQFSQRPCRWTRIASTNAGRVRRRMNAQHRRLPTGAVPADAGERQDGTARRAHATWPPAAAPAPT